MEDQLIDKVVKNFNRFSSPVFLETDCYDVSPLFAKRILPAASTERWVDEQLTDELLKYSDYVLFHSVSVGRYNDVSIIPRNWTIPASLPDGCVN